MFKISKINHVAIIVSNYDISKKFYCDILNLVPIRETFRADRNSYKLDLAINEESQIELFSFPHSPERLAYPEARGLRHLAFTVENLDAYVAYLREKKVVVEDIRIDEITGCRFAFFYDPDKLPLELYESTKNSKTCV